MAGSLRDFSQAFRTLRRSPTLAITAVLTLALGLGANAAMFSATYALLLKPLPYRDSGELVALFETKGDRTAQQVSLLDFLDWQERSRSFESMAAYRPRSFGLHGEREAVVEVVQVGMVTSGLFEVLGVQPVLGRTFTVKEEGDELPLIVLEAVQPGIYLPMTESRNPPRPARTSPPSEPKTRGFWLGRQGFKLECRSRTA